MSSHSDHARWDLCRNPFTRSHWIWVFLLLFTSPVTRGIAVGGTVLVGTGCEDEVTYEDCDQAVSECLDECAPDDADCRTACDADADGCYEEAYQTAQRHEAWADAASMCLTVAVCTLETIGNSRTHSGDGDADGPDPDPDPQPDPNDDWGEDWGEQQPNGDDDLDLVRYVDLPEED